MEDNFGWKINKAQENGEQFSENLWVGSLTNTEIEIKRSDKTLCSEKGNISG